MVAGPGCKKISVGQAFQPTPRLTFRLRRMTGRNACPTEARVNCWGQVARHSLALMSSFEPSRLRAFHASCLPWDVEHEHHHGFGS